MPIQPINFPMLSFEQNNPVLGGLGYSQDIIANLMKNAKAKAELPYAGQLAQSTAAYKKAMADYLSGPLKALSSLSHEGKLQLEPGVLPDILKRYGHNGTVNNGSNDQINPPNGQGNPPTNQGNPPNNNLQDYYRLAQLKATTDPKIRERVGYAVNLHKTLNTIDPNIAFQYSGLTGGIQKGKDIISSLISGKTVPTLKDFENQMTSLDLFAKQVRQFYGDSITDTVQKDLKAITNPNSWKRNPDVAMEKFNRLKNIVGMETDTFINALKTPSAYGLSNINENENENENDVIRVKDPDGNTGTIPVEDLDKALQAGYVRIE